MNKDQEWYEIDWERVISLNDLKRILQALDLNFTLGYDKFHIIGDLLKRKANHETKSV